MDINNPLNSTPAHFYREITGFSLPAVFRNNQYTNGVGNMGGRILYPTKLSLAVHVALYGETYLRAIEV